MQRRFSLFHHSVSSSCVSCKHGDLKCVDLLPEILPAIGIYITYTTVQEGEEAEWD